MSFILILSVHFFALLTPGVDFLLVCSYALKQDFKQALKAVFGISFAILLWIILSLAGLNLLFKFFPLLQIFLSFLGACYLLYLTFLLLKNLKNEQEFKENKNSKAFLSGFLTNISNPKSVLYFGSIFSSFSFDDNVFLLFLLVLILSLESFIYFAFIAFVFSKSRVKNFYMKHSKKLDILCATFFTFFAFCIFAELINKEF